MTIADVFAKKNYKVDRIEKLLKKITELDPRNYVAYTKLAFLYHRRNQSNMAMEYYKRAVETQPLFALENSDFVDLMNTFHKQQQQVPEPKTNAQEKKAKHAKNAKNANIKGN